MPYKVVQTLERGKNILVVVPSLWEDKGRLWWPPKKSLFKLMKEEQSRPSKDWKIMQCTLKRNNISTYQRAEEELSIMEENSDTDGQDTAMVNPQETIVLPSQNQAEINFELLANNLICNRQNQEESSINYSSVTAAESVSNTENVLQILSAETVDLEQILSNQRIMSEKIDNVLQIQGIALENQRKIAQELATQSVQLQEITAQLAEIKEGTSVTLLKDVNPVDNESFTLKPIENQRELISLDQLLTDKAERNKLRKKLSFICSSFNGTGITCAYKLTDILFSRDFLCLCSWAGGSRGEMSKIALKDYKNVLKFFHAMIQTWDPTYTVQDNEIFFKVITKNSMQRKAMKNIRMSSKRCRMNKRQKTEKGQETDNIAKETGENMQLEEQTVAKEAEEESISNQEQAIGKENIPLNNISDDESEFDLC